MRTLVLILASSSVLLAQKLDPREIIRRSIAATERSWKARQNYTYLERDEERHLDSRGGVKSTNVSITKTVVVDGVAVDQTVSHNGGPPTPAENKKNQEALRKAKSPADRAEELRKAKENRAFIEEIPSAFDFKLLAEQQINGREAYLLLCTPKPGFHARGKYGKMYSKVEGKVWVDKQDFGWIKVDAKVTEPFSMGLFLARVQPGSHIVFEQARIADGLWMPQRIQVKAEAKILFVKNYVQEEVITYSAYRPAQPTEVASAPLSTR
ncbi:MAG: hypothetical protein JWO48_1082 [Bryobacterales bacterium]|nr:hypothetical protein [Bryobacterales bacterium]